QSFWGPRGAQWLTLAMAMSASGALHVVILTGARIPYAMSRDRLFFKFAERLHPSFHTPSGSLLFLGSVAAALALSGTFEELYSLFVFAVDILRVGRRRAAAIADEATAFESALSGVGISVDSADFSARRNRSHSESLDRAPGSVHHWIAGDCGGNSVLL